MEAVQEPDSRRSVGCLSDDRGLRQGHRCCGGRGTGYGIGEGALLGTGVGAAAGAIYDDGGIRVGQGVG